MTPEALREQFDALADAPGGVQRLREMILQLAVRGKLVPQDADDEPASMLLDRVSAEQQRLRSAGKAERDQDLTAVKPDDADFVLPESWRWAPVGALTTKIGSGSTPRGGRNAYTPRGVPFIRSQNVWDEGLRLDDVALIPQDVHSQMAGTHVQAGDILLNITGASIGRSAIVPEPFGEANVSQHVAIVRPVDKAMTRFLHATIVSPYFQGLINGVQVGISREGLSKARLARLTVPVPPLAEQRRIVGKVDQLMALCDELEERQSRRAELRVRLNRSALHRLTAASDDGELGEAWERVHEQFPLLYDTPATVGELRQAIMQLAVRGKLVDFDPISTRRSLNSLLCQPSLNGIATKPSDTPPGTPILRISAGTSRRDAIVDEADHKFIDIDEPTVAKFRLRPGDLLACRFNGNLHFVGRFSLYQGESRTSQVFPDKLIRFRVDREVCDPAYLRYVMNSPAIRVEIEKMCGTTAGNIGISAGKLKTVQVPVPPLAEQRRIIATVDQLMALCDELEARLTRAVGKAERLAASVVHHLSAA